jgi:hypothetical protein
LLDQLLVTNACADSRQRRSLLRVEHRLGHHTAGMLEGNQVLAGTMHYLEDGFVGEYRRQRGGHAGDQRVDQQHRRVAAGVVERDLHQRQLRPVRAFADEFGVEAYAGGGMGKMRLQCGGVGNPDVHDSGG